MRKLELFIDSMSNLIYYFKVIWGDRQWDYMYIENILLKKYKRMYKSFYRNDTHENTKKYAQALRICIMILHRREQCWYMEVPYDSAVEDRDWKIYCRIIEKYHEKWWD